MGPDLTPIHPRSQGLFPIPLYLLQKEEEKEIEAVINHPTQKGKQHQQAVRYKNTNMIKQLNAH